MLTSKEANLDNNDGSRQQVYSKMGGAEVCSDVHSLIALPPGGSRHPYQYQYLLRYYNSDMCQHGHNRAWFCAQLLDHIVITCALYSGCCQSECNPESALYELPSTPAICFTL